MNRSDEIRKLETTEIFDIIIIGGGATGLGCALDAASRGYKTLCIERNDFSKGTSSRSTKLIHGGVRYLEQGNIKMVQSALKERFAFINNSPTIANVLPFVLPVYSYWKWLYYGFGLMLYDFLSGKLSVGKTRILSKATTISKLSGIKKEGLKGGILYYDGQFDDSLMCLGLAQQSIGYGSTVVNYMECTSISIVKNKVYSITIKDIFNNKTYEIQTKCIINATGVFADQILRMVNKSHKTLVKPSKGVHIVIDKKHFNGDNALLIPKTDDNRVLFAVPWKDKVVIGTTDIGVKSVDEDPVATNEEINFILNNFNKYSENKIKQEDILSVFAGLRPLVKNINIKSTSNLLRDHSIFVHRKNLITITGGKWTTYRKMAQDAINTAVRIADLPKSKCITQNLKITFNRESATNSGSQLHPESSLTDLEIIAIITNEMAMTIEDILARRYRLLFTDARLAIILAPSIGKILQDYYQYDDNWLSSQVESFTKLAVQYLPNSKI